MDAAELLQRLAPHERVRLPGVQLERERHRARELAVENPLRLYDRRLGGKLIQGVGLRLQAAQVQRRHRRRQ